jgi:hypothetical protein
LKYKDVKSNVIYFVNEVNGLPMVCYVIPNAIINMTPQPYYIYDSLEEAQTALKEMSIHYGWKPLKEGEI